MSEFLINFGKKIKGYRDFLGISQEKLAELINVSTTIASLENGKTFIKYKNLKKLCNALNINEVDLFNFSMTEKENSSMIEKITEKVKQLTPLQQKQILEIIKTFE